MKKFYYISFFITFFSIVIFARNNDIPPTKFGSSTLNNIQKQFQDLKDIKGLDKILKEYKLSKAKSLKYKMSEDNGLKYNMDSMVLYVKHNDEWLPVTKDAYNYDDQSNVVSSDSYVFDTTLVTWKDNKKTIVTFNEKELPVMYNVQSWDDTLKEWFDESKAVIAYDENGNITAMEMTNEYYDFTTETYQTFGQGKFIREYDGNNNETSLISFEWDEQLKDWEYDFKYERQYQNGWEIMNAYYSWDSESQTWTGMQKNETNFVLGFYDTQAQTSYNWDATTNDWKATSEIKYDIIVDVSDTNVVETRSYLNFDTNKLEYNSKKEYFGFKRNYKSGFNYSFNTVISYYWDSNNSDWLENNKRIFKYDSFGNDTLIIDSVWRSISDTDYGWVLQHEMHKFVNELGLYTGYSSKNWRFDGNNIVLSSQDQSTSTFDDNWHLLSTVQQSWDFNNNVWQNTTKSEYTYNANESLTSSTNYSGFDEVKNEWIPMQKTEMDYNADFSYAYYKSYNWDIDLNEWKLVYAQYSEQNENGYATHSGFGNYDYNVNQFYLNYEDIREYDNENRLTMHSELNRTLQYDEYVPFVLTYGDKVEYSYSNEGQIVSEINYTYESDDFIPQNKYEYSYDAQHPDGLESEIYYEWNALSSSWEKKTKGVLTTNYDVKRDQLILPFGEEDESHELKMYFNYMATEFLQYIWSDDTNDWVENTNYKIYYSSHEPSGLIKKNSSDISLYPNPTSDFISVNLNEGDNANIALYDLQGRKVYESSVVNSSRIDVSQFNKGIYFYQLSVEGKTVSGKLIKR